MPRDTSPKFKHSFSFALSSTPVNICMKTTFLYDLDSRCKAKVRAKAKDKAHKEKVIIYCGYLFGKVMTRKHSTTGYKHFLHIHLPAISCSLAKPLANSLFARGLLLFFSCLGTLKYTLNFFVFPKESSVCFFVHN